MVLTMKWLVSHPNIPLGLRTSGECGTKENNYSLRDYC